MPAYLSFFKAKLGEATQAQFGLRAEHTISEAIHQALTPFLKRNYLKCLPSGILIQ